MEIRAKGGTANFFSLGEDISVTDSLADGYGTRAYLHWSSTEKASVTNSKGAGTRVTKRLSIPEGTTVYLTLCDTDNGVDVKCSKSHRGEA